MPIDQSTLDRIRSEHTGDLFHLPDPDDEQGGIVVRLPTRAEWARFQSQLGDDKRISKAMEQFVRDCLVYPDKPAFEAMLDARPGLASTWGKTLGEKAGAGREIEAKKL